MQELKGNLILQNSSPDLIHFKVRDVYIADNS